MRKSGESPRSIASLRGPTGSRTRTGDFFFTAGFDDFGYSGFGADRFFFGRGSGDGFYYLDRSSQRGEQEEPFPFLAPLKTKKVRVIRAMAPTKGAPCRVAPCRVAPCRVATSRLAAPTVAARPWTGRLWTVRRPREFTLGRPGATPRPPEDLSALVGPVRVRRAPPRA